MISKLLHGRSRRKLSKDSHVSSSSEALSISVEQEHLRRRLLCLEAKLLTGKGGDCESPAD